VRKTSDIIKGETNINKTSIHVQERYNEQTFYNTKTTDKMKTEEGWWNQGKGEKKHEGLQRTSSKLALLADCVYYLVLYIYTCYEVQLGSCDGTSIRTREHSENN